MSITDQIKQRVTIRDAALAVGLHEPNRGEDWTCPQHGGKSLRLKEDEGYFYCHGGCADHGGKGDIFNLVQFVKGGTFAEALQELAHLANISLHQTPEAIQEATKKREQHQIYALAMAFFRAQYAGSPAEQYARVEHLETEAAHLGYAPDSWQALTEYLKSQQVDLDQAVEAGVLSCKNGSYYSVLRHRLVTPVTQSGQIIYLQGRVLTFDGQVSIGQTWGPDEAGRKYKNTRAEKPLFYSLNGALSRREIILTESTSDVQAFAYHQIGNAVATLGSTLRVEQLKQLSRFERVYLAINNDQAGHAMADQVANQIGEALRIVPPPNQYKDWRDALKANQEWQPDPGLTWYRWKLRSIPGDGDPIIIKDSIDYLINYLVTIDESTSLVYLMETKAHFNWNRDILQAYQRELRIKRNELASAVGDTATASAESETIGETAPPPFFVRPALAEHNAIVYVSQYMAFELTVPAKKKGEQPLTSTVYKPLIISSERRRLMPQKPKPGTDQDSIVWLDESSNLALLGGLNDAARDRWSYESIVSFLNATETKPSAHEVYDQLMASLRRYVYHADESSYVIDVLWAMGTYYHQHFNAYPYLALHGHKGAGKSTLLTWLSQVCFNAQFIINTSEASLYRSIQALAPTLLIDEQEGLNSSKAAKENKADLMGILKAGYKKGGYVARQRMDRPEQTEYFETYSPKALAAIEHFEDVLENRAILTFMAEKPHDVQLHESDQILSRDKDEFGPLRDQMYLLLMHDSSTIHRIARSAQLNAENRFRELFKPLVIMAAYVDLARGTPERSATRLLIKAIEEKAQIRKERDQLTPEAQLRDALRLVCDQADAEPDTYATAFRQSDGLVVADTLQIKEAFESLFSDRRQSFFNDQWLGKNVQKTPGIQVAPQRRRRRDIHERDPLTGEVNLTTKQVICYLIDPETLYTS